MIFVSKIRVSFEITIIAFTCIMLILKLNEFFIQNMRLYLELLTNGNRMYIWVAIVSIFLVAVMRFTCNRDGEDILSVILIICLVFYFTYFARFERSQYFFINLFILKFKLIYLKKVL
jgi:hypothetical protein